MLESLLTVHCSTMAGHVALQSAGDSAQANLQSASEKAGQAAHDAGAKATEAADEVRKA